MNEQNSTSVAFFVIKGISDVAVLQILVFVFVFLIYLITFTGNLTIFMLVCLEPHLHTPMYFFLSNLSVMDLSASTIALHKLLLMFVSGNNTVSFISCMSQMFIFLSLTCCEAILLTIMGYDRYVAICNPLHYYMVMKWSKCVQLAIVCWIIGFVEIIPNLWEVVHYSCYKSNHINHFFCDIVPLMSITCSSTYILKMYILFVGGLLCGFTPLFLTFLSYVFIISNILGIRSRVGRQKAFYTCSSHLTVVILLYFTLFCQYLNPGYVESSNFKLFSLVNTAVVPMLNPLIYSLKNKDVKIALRHMLKHNKAVF
ncbi:olfactory receptor 2AP1-like [Hyperolius riggenbachi]|uniref:olfactory receptor 2AP1-like n=1 Tax=Hyperolius riggenbachi TaxID=752182 RepID=UPI0035A32F8C